MTATVTKRELVQALGLMAEVCGHRAAWLTVEQDAVVIAGQHDSVQARLRVPAEIMLGAAPEPMPVYVALLQLLVQQAPQAVVELDRSGPLLGVRSGAYDIRAERAQEASPFEAPNSGPVALTVQASELRDAVNAVIYAASNNAFQAVFRGIFITGTAEGLTLVGSDGYRVATARLPVSSPVAFSTLLHAGHLRTLLKFIKDLDLVTLHVSGTHVTARAALLTLVLPVMDGDYPDWQRIVPTPKTHLKVDGAALRAAVDRAALLTDQNSNHRLELLIRDRLTLKALGDYGSACEVVDSAREGECHDLYVNARFLSDALARTAGTVTLGLTNANTPFTVTSDGAPGVTAILVTLRP